MTALDVECKLLFVDIMYDDGTMDAFNHYKKSGSNIRPLRNGFLAARSENTAALKK